MNSKELVSKVWKKAEELCEDTGLSVWDVTFEKEGKNYYLTVFIDREEGGVYRGLREDKQGPWTLILSKGSFLRCLPILFRCHRPALKGG